MNKKNIGILLTILASVFALMYVIDHYLINRLFSLLKAAYLVYSFFMMGYLISRRAIRSSFLNYIGKGMIVSCFYFFLLSCLKLVNTYSVLIYLILPLIAGLIFLLRGSGHREKILSELKHFFSRPVLEYAVFLLPLIYALLPSTFYDSLVYHLGLPNFFLQNGGFIPAPQLMYANMFIYYEVTLIPAVFLGDFVPRILHFMLGVIFIFSVVDYSRGTFKIKQRLVVLLAIVSMPLTIFLITAVKADLVTALFLFLALVSYKEEHYHWSAVFFAFSVGIKVFSVVALPVFFTVVILQKRKLHFKRHFLMGLLMLLILLPLLVKNYTLCGNPVFPFFPEIFPSEMWDASRFSIVRTEVSSHFHTLLDFIRAPFDFSFKTQGAGGVVGPLFIIFLPFLFIHRVKDRLALYFSLGVLLLGAFFGEAFRYIYVVFILLAIYVGAAYERIEFKIKAVIFGLVVFINCILAITMVETLFGARFIFFDKNSVNQYRVENFPTYAAYDLVNTEAPPGSRILVAGEARTYYLKRPYMAASALDYSILKKYIGKSANPRQFTQMIKEDGYDYLLFNIDEFMRLQKGYQRLSEPEVNKLFGFFKQILPYKKEGPTYIYKL